MAQELPTLLLLRFCRYICGAYFNNVFAVSSPYRSEGMAAVSSTPFESSGSNDTHASTIAALSVQPEFRHHPTSQAIVSCSVLANSTLLRTECDSREDGTRHAAKKIVAVLSNPVQIVSSVSPRVLDRSVNKSDVPALEPLPFVAFLGFIFASFIITISHAT